MKTLFPSRAKLDSPIVGRILDHSQNSRVANAELRRRGKTVSEIADSTGLHYNTVCAFLGLAGDRNTRDPRTSTTTRIFGDLGFELVFRRRPN